MTQSRFSWRSIVAGICALLAAGGIHRNIQQGIPENALPAYAIGLYTPAALLIAVAVVLIVSEFRRNVAGHEKN